jgi:Pyruvate/2-oxoacid:ferredoxin oxidoreductase delta subunit
MYKMRDVQNNLSRRLHRGIGDEFFIPDETYCKGCGMCAEECPSEAITMELEEK